MKFRWSQKLLWSYLLTLRSKPNLLPLQLRWKWARTIDVAKPWLVRTSINSLSQQPLCKRNFCWGEQLLPHQACNSRSDLTARIIISLVKTGYSSTVRLHAIRKYTFGTVIQRGREAGNHSCSSHKMLHFSKQYLWLWQLDMSELTNTQSQSDQFTLETVRLFMVQKGHVCTNHDLVAKFKPHLNHPVRKRK